MNVICNGEPREVASETTIAQLLEILKLQPRQVAVEVNLELVPRALHAETVLKAEDRLEVVTLVGGG